MPHASWPVVDGDIVDYKWLNALGLKKIWDTTDAGVTFPVASVTTTGFDLVTYSSLIVVWTARTSQAVTLETLAWRYNSLSAANYYHERLSGVGASVASAEALANTSAAVGVMPGASAHAAGDFGDGLIIFPHFNNPLYTFYHAISLCLWNTTTGTAQIETRGGYYVDGNMSTAQFFPQSGGNFVAGTRFTLYGAL